VEVVGEEGTGEVVGGPVVPGVGGFSPAQYPAQDARSEVDEESRRLRHVVHDVGGLVDEVGYGNGAAADYEERPAEVQAGPGRYQGNDHPSGRQDLVRQHQQPESAVEIPAEFGKVKEPPLPPPAPDDAREH